MNKLCSSRPLVTIVTPNFNGERYLKRVVESVSRQHYSVEQIIVDDCSTDGSWQLLLQLAEKYPWLIPVRLERNSGPVVARNKAIELARGRFLAFLDVDDFWLPHKLATQIPFMLEKECGLSFSDYRFVSEDGRFIGRRLRGLDRVGWHSHHMTRHLGCLTVVLDRLQFPGFRFPNVSPACRAEDFLAWSYCIRIAGSALRCPYDLARYSVVEGSRSSNARFAASSVWELYRQVEGLNFFAAAFYYSFYALGVIWKRYRYRPLFQRGRVDKQFEWSVLPRSS
jgi:teichuronic acid biosynthesis glycosyltransferase TuaG